MKPRHTPPSTQLRPVESAKAVGLRYVTDAQAGIRRLKVLKRFRYQYSDGKPVRSEVILKRIQALVIPPAWTNVWICSDANGHLQATGRDAKGRKQHRYHSLWREVRDATKYDRMIEFGEALPHIRRRLASDLRRPGLPREKVLATIVRLMDLSYIRVGNEEYAKQNGSYGLTTMKDSHAKIRGERIDFSFRGKSGKFHTIQVADRNLAKIVKHCQDIPGQDLFQYLNEKGKRRDVTSGDVNDYLREVSGTDFTAKDFRTWAGTVLTAQALKHTTKFHSQKQAKNNLKQVIEAVAEKLGNTPAVCRKCYIHPFILDGYINRKLPFAVQMKDEITRAVSKTSSRSKTSLSEDEGTILKFLRCARREEQRTVRRANAKSAAIPRAWRLRAVRGMRVGHR